MWFYEPASQRNETESNTLRTLDELIYTYHATVGHNTNLELDFAIDRKGEVQKDHALLYKRFGNWLRSCYGGEGSPGTAIVDGGTTTALAEEVARGEPVTSVRLSLGTDAKVFDRVVLTEDQTDGQKIRGWLVEWSADGTNWTTFGKGKSIGNKRIVLAKGAQSFKATDVRLNITASYGGKPSAAMRVHAPCLTGTVDTITKLGTEDIGMTETTPIVFKGQLYRFESLRSGNWNNTYECTNTSPGEGRKCQSLLRFRKQSGPPDWKTGEVVTSPFGVGWALGCAIVDDDAGRVHVFASKEAQEIGTWSSDTLSPQAKWTASTALTLPSNLQAFNTAVAKGPIDGKDGYAMLIEVRGTDMPGGFNIIVATAESLAGPWDIGEPAPTPAPAPGPCTEPIRGYCSWSHATPTHSSTGVIATGSWPAPTLAAAQAAVSKLCDANISCAAFGLGTDSRSSHQYQLYPASPTVLEPLPTDDWTLYYKNKTCCVPPGRPTPTPPVTPARIFGPGSCPALRYDNATGYWHMLYTPNPTVPNGGYRTWQIYAARSRTLASRSWEKSGLNPIFEADAFDRQIHNTAIPEDQQGWAANTTNLNDSDPDLVEFEGQVLFVGNCAHKHLSHSSSVVNFPLLQNYTSIKK